jgi:hypothetical protein
LVGGSGGWREGLNNHLSDKCPSMYFNTIINGYFNLCFNFNF